MVVALRQQHQHPAAMVFLQPILAYSPMDFRPAEFQARLTRQEAEEVLALVNTAPIIPVPAARAEKAVLAATAVPA
jgi:hypothetical protein